MNLFLGLIFSCYFQNQIHSPLFFPSCLPSIFLSFHCKLTNYPSEVFFPHKDLVGLKLRILIRSQWWEDFPIDGSEYSNILKMLQLPSGLLPGDIVHYLSPVVWCPWFGYETNHQLSNPFNVLMTSELWLPTSVITADWIYWGATEGAWRTLMKKGVQAESWFSLSWFEVLFIWEQKEEEIPLERGARGDKSLA